MKDIDATIEEMEFYGRPVRDKWRGISLRAEHCWDCKFSNAREDDPEDDDKCKLQICREHPRRSRKAEWLEVTAEQWPFDGGKNAAEIYKKLLVKKDPQ